MHLKNPLTLVFSLLVTNQVMVFSENLPSPPEPDPLSLPAGLNVLVIGDSNTEIGHITGGLAKIIEEKHGYFGSGYHSLNAPIGMGSGYLPYLKIENVGAWQKPAMVKPGAPKPYTAPDGSYIFSRTPGAHTDITFQGTAVDVYWLADSNGGEFTAAIDSGTPQTVGTRSEIRSVQRTTLSGFSKGRHTLVLTVVSPVVTLLGVDAYVETPVGKPRGIVHKWGKGWATTRDYIDINPAIFSDSLRLIQPDVTVILLGTNDHNLAGHNRDQFAVNMREIVARIKTAVPNSRVLVLSTFQVNSPWSNNGLKKYLEILPDLCRQTGAYYWDMSSWLGGPWAKNQEAGLMLDNVHVNANGGEKIAGQFYEEILKVAEAKPGTPLALPPDREENPVGKALPENGVPRQIPGLIAWWSADGQAVVDKTGGVIRWVDGSGNKSDAIAPWPWSRPRYVKNAADGKALLQFDGSHSHLLFPMLAEAQTIFMVLRADKMILGHPYFNMRPFHSGIVRPKKAFSANYAAKAVTGGKGYLNGKEVYLPDDQDTALEFDPEHLQLFSLVTAGPAPFSYLGWGGSWNFDRYLKGFVAEVVVYNRALSDGERRQVEQDLASRWNIVDPVPQSAKENK